MVHFLSTSKSRLFYVIPTRLVNYEFGHSRTPSLPLPPLPPSFPHSLSRGTHPPKPTRESGERCKLPQWGLGRSSSRQTIWHISDPKVAALVATVFVHFHKNKFKFLYKHETACLAVAIVWVWGQSTQWDPGVKPLIRGLVGGRSPPEVDHADDILQFNAHIC